MNVKKLYQCIFAYISIMVSICMGTNDIHAQYKLDLSNDGVILMSNNKRLSLDSLELKPNAISINEIAITYDGHTKNDIVITTKDSCELLKKQVNNGLNAAEIKNILDWGLVLSAGESYIIKHGDKIWQFQYGEAEVAGSVDSTSVDSSDGGTNVVNSGDNKENNSVIIDILLVLFICSTILLGYLYFVLRKRLKSINTKLNGKVQKDLDNGISDDSEKKSESDGASIEEDSRYRTVKAEEILNKLCDSNNNFSLEEKYELLRTRLDNNAALMKAIEGICAHLGIRDIDGANSNVVEAKICQAIDNKNNELRNLRTQKESLEVDAIIGTDNAVMEVYKSLLAISRTSNYSLKPFIIQAQKKYESSATSEKDILIEVLNSLPNLDKKSTPISLDSNVISDSQINSSVNQPILKKWLIGQLRMNGIEVVNSNTAKDEILKGIAQQLINAQRIAAEEKSRIPDEEVVSKAIMENRLQEKDRRIILERIVDALNKALISGTEKIKSNISKEDLIEMVATKLSLPSDQEEAMNQVKERILKVVNDAFGSTLTKLNKEQLRTVVDAAVVDTVNNVLDTSANSLEEAKIKLRDINSTLATLQKKYGVEVEDASQLEKAIVDKRFEQIKKSVSSELEKLFPGEHFDSAQKLVNALIKVAKDSKESYEHAKEADELVQDSLQESIAIMNQNVITEGKSLLELVDIYNTEISNKTKVWNEERVGLIRNNEASLEQLNEKIKENESLNQDKDSLQGKLKDESSEMVTYLHTVADKIRDAWRPILKGCSEEDENQCMDIENRLRNNLLESLKSFERYKATDELNPSQTRKEIQNLLIDKLTMENSPFNVIGRYFAYSRLPFMTDTAREYGVIFNRKNIGTLYSAVEGLYVYFGINLDIPVLFAMGIEEGEFINVTGRAYGDLDNLCQNSRNHFDNIDSKNKPSEVIVDVVQVGYALADGSSERKRPTVLTY